MDILGVDFNTSKLKESNNTYTVLDYLEYNDIDTDDIRENYKIFRIPKKSNQSVYSPSTPPPLEWLKEDWWLILNDTENCKIHVFCIPAGAISEAKIKNNIGTRDGKDVINFNIYKKAEDGKFYDKKSGLCFNDNKWLKKSLDY